VAKQSKKNPMADISKAAQKKWLQQKQRRSDPVYKSERCKSCGKEFTGITSADYVTSISDNNVIEKVFICNTCLVKRKGTN
jgi:hypothetical protein